MSFMYNPYPFDDPRAVNKPVLSDEVINSLTTGTGPVAARLAGELADRLAKAPGRNVVAALDGYTTAEWTRTVNLISQQLSQRGIELEVIDFASVYKDGSELNAMFDPMLEWDRDKDPTLLYGRIFKRGYEAIFDPVRLDRFKSRLRELAEGSEGKAVIVYGNGCTVEQLRTWYDLVCWFDVTPKEAVLRVRRGQYRNLGDVTARPVNQVIRRCYYMDFEMALHLRGELLKGDLLDYYLPSDNPDNVQLIPMDRLGDIFFSLAGYPFRCKPVYLEGIWGGTYIKDLRRLPDGMRNCAWVFDLIPMEVSIVVEAGGGNLEFPFFAFLQKQGVSVMGQPCVDKFGGYFPIRFNYDDTYHSNGNMSIQVHSGEEYNKENFDELGRQDESYYVVVAAHNAKTYVGFRDDADTGEFIRAIKEADTKHTPVDYEKYVSYEESKPGMQVMIPAGTIHASGRNQVVLEIGSLTIGSYTYKLYDYLRADFDGKPRPIHTWHGERTLATDRNASWVRDNIVQQPRQAASGDGWAEYIIGEHDLVYFSLRRLEFEKMIPQDTGGRFHVLTLVDGERVRVRSVDHPERSFDQQYMDIVIVPADMGRYVIENLGTEPICIHKTMLKDGFEND